jgi:hypothetical protein
MLKKNRGKNLHLPPIIEIADSPIVDVPMADRSLSGLNWPLVSFQCDHTPCDKVLRAFPVSMIAATCPSRQTVGISLRDFAI